MITLLTFPKLDAAFSPSPFCVKAALMLDHSGLPWQREDVPDPRKFPHGKLPAIRTATGQLIGDSDGIRRHLEDQGISFQTGLGAAQRGYGRALIRLAEDHLYFLLLLDRWGNPEVWPVVREMFFAEIPALLRKPVANGMRRRLLRGLDAQGLGRFSAQERMQRAEQDLTAVAECLSEHPFLLGNAVSLADFSMAPMLEAVSLTPVETALARRVAGDAALMAYVDRVKAAAQAGPSAPHPM